MDPHRFTAIEIEGQTCFISRRANMFGHSRLYRPNPMDATQLVHEQEFALRTTSGAWKTVGKQIPRLSQPAIRNAQAQLTSLTTAWPASLEEASSAERLKFEADYLALSKASNAESFSEIAAYTEGGSAAINPVLRIRYAQRHHKQVSPPVLQTQAMAWHCLSLHVCIQRRSGMSGTRDRCGVYR
ncbi:Uncharacterized protein ALO71_04206 [Pseudomonas amygdali pv. dendropanacis]|uniref:Uncharacterized protein n=1 Tax=Pseudomonas amygdali pv. dendropanacis TaxID=235272 RepID=A0A0N8RFP8_PSEA0|nr:Uncharacterized protein ALO71_04206 [Pseudomonas amygdali pv. dendropanacis]